MNKFPTAGKVYIGNYFENKTKLSISDTHISNGKAYFKFRKAVWLKIRSDVIITISLPSAHFINNKLIFTSLVSHLQAPEIKICLLIAQIAAKKGIIYLIVLNDFITRIVSSGETTKRNRFLYSWQ